MRPRLLLIQTGEYAEAYHRLASGGEENFYAQAYSIDYMGEFAARLEAVGVLSICTRDHEETLPNRVVSLGMTPYPADAKPRWDALFAMISRFAPTHVITHPPLYRLIPWAAHRGLRVLPWLADSFQSRGLRAAYRKWREIHALRHRSIDWVSNHNLNACLELADAGLDRRRTVPWDWPSIVTPDQSQARPHPPDGPIRLFYAGQVIPGKGVGDAVAALGILRNQGREATLTIAGGGDAGPFRDQAVGLGIASAVEFLGKVSHRRVLELMREHTAILIPSRHEYPEGLPMVIYEGLCSRTPIVASDHPMFRGKLNDRVDSLAFPAGDPAALADRILTLVSEAGLYGRLSAASPAAWSRLKCPVQPRELFQHWIDDGPDDRAWLASYSLASGRYDELIAASRR